ncbi:hypothetical protein V7128_16935 [Neobacillus vireti]|uniref:hypothetical protein n=1 Tax=Neobacillus vireti TaxID=220686 RepID=UPI002FFF2BB1
MTKMNEITEIKAIVDEHFTDVANWLARQQSACRTLEDVDAVFATAQRRAEQGLTKLNEIEASADQQEHLDIVRAMFDRQIAVYNYGAKRNYKKSVKLAKRAEKLSFAYERRLKGK